LRTRTTISCALVLFLAAATGSCGIGNTSRIGQRDLACAIIVTSTGVPQLHRQGEGEVAALPAGASVHCAADGPPDPRSACETLDDLEALEGKVMVCGPMGPEPPTACPALKKRRILRDPAPLVAERPCGEGAGPNVQIRLEDAAGRVLSRVVFYDDPSCHTSFRTPPSCGRQKRPAYYRVLSVASYFRDEGECR
jgi:hypothetical protein